LNEILMESIAKSALSALIAYSTHYGVAKVYDAVCVPDGFWGYVRGLISMGSPICQAGVQIITHTQVSYSSILMMGITRTLVDMILPGVVLSEPIGK
jgi:hypothetical protein